MKLLINADDFGWDDDTVDATIDCFEKGALTSATIMPSMPAVLRACEYAKRNPRFSFGVHLTYVGDGPEHALSDPSTIPHLAHPSGELISSQKIRLRAMLRRIDPRQAEIETIAQIEKIKSLGVNISHVDSHGHMHKFHPFRVALSRVLPKFGITKVRSVQDIYLSRAFQSTNYWLGPYWKRAVDKLFTTTDHLYLPRSAREGAAPGHILDVPIKGSLEIGLHPGHKEDWRIGERDGAIQLAADAKKRGIQLITWNDIT